MPPLGAETLTLKRAYQRVIEIADCSEPLTYFAIVDQSAPPAMSLEHGQPSNLKLLLIGNSSVGTYARISCWLVCATDRH